MSSDMTGLVFGRWTVISRAPDGERRKARWNCQCECGAVAIVWFYNLRSGKSKSCGCLKRELSAARATIHDGAETPEYIVWEGMKNRCRNPRHAAYKRYGGRGIMVCERWANFQAFIEDMGPRPSPKHSIERNDNNGNYEPSNCRWATKLEQANNVCSNRIVIIDGEPMSMATAHV